VLQLERSFQRFTAFYSGQHSGRKLNWLYQMSKGELVTNCFKNRYTLQVCLLALTLVDVHIHTTILHSDDDADAKKILTAPRQRTERDHQGVPVSRGWTPSSEIWERTTSHWTKQSIWLRTALCGGWCLCMALHTPSGACQKRRSLFVLSLIMLSRQWDNP